MSLAARILRVLPLGLFLLAPASCGGDSAPLPKNETARVAAPAAESLLPGLELPRPSQLAARNRAVSGEQLLSRSGEDIEPTLPNNRTDGDLGERTFMPDYAAPDKLTLHDASYAGYSFNLTGLEGSHYCRLMIPLGAQLDDSNLFFGVANFAHDRWQWFGNKRALPLACNLADVSDYMGPDGECYVLLLMLGQQELLAQSLSFVQYDEFEPNDAPELGINEIPEAKLRGLIGSLGGGPGYPGTDGDNVDYWLVPVDELAPGGCNQLDAWLSTGSSGNSPSMWITDLSAEDVLAFSAVQVNGTVHMTCDFDYYFEGNPPEFLFIVVFLNGGYTDYQLDVTLGYAPIPDFNFNPTEGEPPLNVTFDGSASDQDGAVVSYDWVLDAQQVPALRESGEDVDHNYTQNGVYPVTLTVTDDTGQSRSIARTLIVGENPYGERENNDSLLEANLLPEIDPGGYRGSVGQPPAGEPSAAYDGDTVDYYKIDLADGEGIFMTIDNITDENLLAIEVLDGGGQQLATSDPQGKLSFVPQNPGTFYFRVEVSPFTFEGYVYDMTWQVTSVPVFTVQADPASGDAPLNVTFTLSVESGGPIVQTVWDWDGNGSGNDDFPNGDPQSFTYTEPGTYEMEVYGQNAGGLIGSATVTVEVTDP